MSFSLLLLIFLCTSRNLSVLARQVRQADRIIFDDELPEDVNINRIAELPVRYSPFTYNLKYFPVTIKYLSYLMIDTNEDR